VKADGGIHGNAIGSDMSFTTANSGTIPPEVNTLAATSVATDSATLNGNLTSLGTSITANVSFDFGLTNAYGNTTIIQPMTATGPFNINVNSLIPGTIYHFRADVDGGLNGNATGSDMTFTTANTGTAHPVVNTLVATSITTNSALISGNLTSMGTAGTVSVSLAYGLTTSYGSTTTIQLKTAPGTFDANLNGLSPGTTYHFRANADGGSNGTASGTDLTFTTVAVPPGVSTLAVTSITSNSASLTGNLISLGTAGAVNVSLSTERIPITVALA